MIKHVVVVVRAQTTRFSSGSNKLRQRFADDSNDVELVLPGGPFAHDHVLCIKIRSETKAEASLMSRFDHFMSRKCQI